ncbi:hypothetical protein GX563_00160 [Candidatus Bathyarchaeota archaeon]|nr:hypothetical protein [Candidatus Bathyarchaeota archaeon]
MRFFTVTDQDSVKHKILVIPLNQTELSDVVGQCEKCMPTITVSSLIQMGHAYVIVDFGATAWKTAIPLDEQSEDGHPVGDELTIGDVLTVFLVSDNNAMQVSGEKVYLNVPLRDVIAFSVLYTAEMAENYAVYKMVQQPKAE